MTMMAMMKMMTMMPMMKMTLMTMALMTMMTMMTMMTIMTMMTMMTSMTMKRVIQMMTFVCFCVTVQEGSHCGMDGEAEEVEHLGKQKWISEKYPFLFTFVCFALTFLINTHLLSVFHWVHTEVLISEGPAGCVMCNCTNDVFLWRLIVAVTSWKNQSIRLPRCRMQWVGFNLDFHLSPRNPKTYTKKYNFLLLRNAIFWEIQTKLLRNTKISHVGGCSGWDSTLTSPNWGFSPSKNLSKCHQKATITLIKWEVILINKRDNYCALSWPNICSFL